MFHFAHLVFIMVKYKLSSFKLGSRGEMKENQESNIFFKTKELAGAHEGKGTDVFPVFILF